MGEAAKAEERFRVACVAALAERGTLGRDPLIGAVRERGVKVKTDTARAWLAALAADPAREEQRERRDKPAWRRR